MPVDLRPHRPGLTPEEESIPDGDDDDIDDSLPADLWFRASGRPFRSCRTAGLPGVRVDRSDCRVYFPAF